MINNKSFLIILVLVIIIFTSSISINSIFAQSDRTNKTMENADQLSNPITGQQNQNQTGS